jgi:precorrin-2 dehydrogenase / sirohydrochlorin ferrochelatase
MTIKYYPSALNVSGRECLVVGNDAEAIDKSIRLAESGGKVTLIGDITDAKDVKRLSGARVIIRKKPFSLDDVEEQFFILYCPKESEEETKALFEKCRARRILLCALDQPKYCDVVNVSVYDRGPLRIMISTDGISPALSKLIRVGLEQSLKDVPLEHYLDELARLRARLEKEIPERAERRKKLIEAVEGFKFKATVDLPAPVKAELPKRRKKND